MNRIAQAPPTTTFDLISYPSMESYGQAANMVKPKQAHGKTVVFLHPDLGIGGAERLVIDAAVGLQNRGHKVVVFTSHCDPRHCFDEARNGKYSSSVMSLRVL